MIRSERAPLSFTWLNALVAAMAIIIAPHTLRMPWWLNGMLVVCALLALLAGHRGWRPPPGWLRALLTVAVAAAIWTDHGTLFGRDAGTTLLVALTGLKLLELRSRRDVLLVLYLGYFLILTQFFHSQSIPSALYLLLATWAITIVLLGVQTPSLMWWRHARLAGVALAQAAPLMVILFVLFPRLPGPLWSVSDGTQSATTGLSDQMTPGAISTLTQSSSVAFRVDWEDEPPPRHALYWRGPVLSHYDGRTWRRARESGAAMSLTPIAEDDGIGYAVMLRPSRQSFLLALDRPLTAPAGSRRNANAELETPRRIEQTRYYRARSSMELIWPVPLSETQRQLNLALPDDRHPRAQALGREWRARYSTDTERLATAVRFFSTRPFSYTLRPPPTRNDVIDEFLFETQSGFCEQYAAAFVVLLRAAGVPARVVTGYLGGEMNPVSDYMIVRQSDAHAWTEIYLEGQGWMRADPTGLIAPERVELGIGAALGAAEPLPTLARPRQSLGRYWRLRWDAVNQHWDRWVLAYGPELQRDVLNRFGITDVARMAGALAGLMVLLTLGLLAVMLFHNRHSNPQDPISRLYRQHLRALAKWGLHKDDAETPTAFAHRVAAEQPDLAPLAKRIAALYLELRYGRHAAPHTQQALAAAVRALARRRPRRLSLGRRRVPLGNAQRWESVERAHALPRQRHRAKRP